MGMTTAPTYFVDVRQSEANVQSESPSIHLTASLLTAASRPLSLTLALQRGTIQQLEQSGCVLARSFPRGGGEGGYIEKQASGSWLEISWF